MSDRVTEHWTEGWSLRQRVKGLRDRYYIGPKAGGHWWGPLADAAVYPSEQAATEAAPDGAENLTVVPTKLRDGKTVER